MSNRFLEIKVTDETRFEGWEIAFDEEVRPTITAMTEKVTGDAQRSFPPFRGRQRGINTGAFRNSIHPLVYIKPPATIEGRVVSSSPYAAIIEGLDEAGNETEYGRRPGAAFPNIDAIRRWVELVIGFNELRSRYLEEHKLTETKVSNETLLDEATLAIGRGIVHKGIKPVRPIGKAFDQNKALINREIDDAIDRAFNR
jgi:hypothetical protein